MWKWCKHVVVFFLFYLSLSLGSINLHAVEAKDFWANSGLSLKVLENYILTNKTCSESKDNYVGCYMAFTLSLADSPTPREEAIRERAASAARYEASKENAISELNKLNFWHKLKSSRFKATFPSEESLAGELYNIFLQNALDPHTFIIPTEELKDNNSGGNNDVEEGVGVLLAKKENDVFILSIYDDELKAKKTLLPGDVIKEIDGHKVNAALYRQSSEWLQDGPLNSEVSLKVERAKKILDVKVQRTTVHDYAISTKILTNPEDNKKVAYINIRHFRDVDVFFKLKEVFLLEKKEGIGSYVVDLRDNRGGDMSYAVNVASTFMKDPENFGDDEKVKKQIYLVGLLKTDLYIGNYSSVPQKTKLPVVLLVNENTASAAEMMASVLREEGRAIIVGQRSFGKASKEVGGAVNFFTPGFDSLPKDIKEKFNDTLYYFKTASLFYTKGRFTHQLTGVPVDIEVQEHHLEKFPLKIPREKELYINPVVSTHNIHTASPLSGEVARIKKQCLSNEDKNQSIEWEDKPLKTALKVLSCL